MPSYETLDAVADAYTPLLALACLAILVRTLRVLQWKALGLRMTSLAAGVCIAYGLMFLDNRFQVWPAAGLDYSTHTAVALVLVMFLSAHWPAVRWLSPLSLLAYALLMVYQRYHTVADIASTAAIVGLLYLPAVMPLFHRRPRRP